MSCQVCHRIICRCGPDLTEALRAQLAEARAEARCAQHGMQQLLEGLLEIDRCATAIIGSNDVQDYAVAVEQAERIGMIVTQITHIAEKATLTELPKMKAVDLTGIERECCGTFHGTPHRSTCKNFNTKTRKRDPFYEDGGSGHDLAI